MARLLSGTRVFGNLLVDTNVSISGTDASISSSTGALIVTGGTGIGGNIYIGGSAGNAVVTSANIAAGNVSVTGSFYVNGSLFVSSGGSTLNFVPTANVSLFEQVSAYTTGTFFPMFSNTATNLGNSTTGVASGFTYNAATGNLTAAGHVGTHWGAIAATTANVGGTLTVGGNTAINNNLYAYQLFSGGQQVVTTGTTPNFIQTANVSIYEQVSAYTTGTFFPVFSNTATNQGNTTTGVASGFTYNATAGNLTAAGFVGTHWGAIAATTANVSGVATINGNLVAASSTGSSNNTTGALVVVGGAGISGNVNTTNLNVTGGVYINGSPVSSASGGGSGAAITDENNSLLVYYPTLSSTTSGSYSAAVVSSIGLNYIPGSGTLFANVFTSLSDETVKTDISTINNAIETLNKLQGVSFTWKDTGARSYGVIAQQVENIIPEIVSTNTNNRKSVNYDALIGFLIQAFKDLYKEHQDLIRKIDGIINDNNKL